MIIKNLIFQQVNIVKKQINPYFYTEKTTFRLLQTAKLVFFYFIE